MKEIFKYTAISICIGVAVNCVSGQLQSNYLVKFLKENLITILLALMAINGTTVGVVLTKMSDMAKGKKGAFASTRKAMHESQVEQLILIALSTCVLILGSSPLLTNYSKVVEFWCDSLLIAIMFYAIVILYDTAKSVFVLLDSEDGED